MELYDLVSTFPNLSDPLFAGKVTALREFAELKLGVGQDNIGSEGLFKSQLFIKRILAPNSTIDAQLIAMAVGTGKTCASTAVAEAVKYNLAGAYGPGRKRCLVVVKGDTVEQSFQDNLSQVCTRGEYLPEADKQYSQSGRRSVITKKINKYYEIVHYIELAKKIARLSPDQIREEYSDRVMIFDESHNLRMGFFAQGKKGDSGALTEEAKEMADLQVYERVWQMLHLAQRKKVLLLTASPVIDRPEEFGLQLNLLLPLELQLTIPGDRNPQRVPNAQYVDWLRPNLSELEPYMRGLISFVRSSTNVARSIDQGVTLELDNPLDEGTIQVILEVSEMSGVQWRHYQRYGGGAVNPNSNDAVVDEPADGAEDTKANSFRQNERYAAMFVFPPLQREIDDVVTRVRDEDGDDAAIEEAINVLVLDGKRTAVGGAAFKDRVRVEKNGSFTLIDNGLRDTLASPDDLRAFSAKYARILELVSNAPTELAFIYTEFVRGHGALLLGLMFEQNGYQRYSGSTFYAADGSVQAPKRRSYAIITGGMNAGYIKNALDAFRAPENRNGDYIQALIGSNVTREGISFRNVQQVHIANPFWNDAPVYQGIGRALREGAHLDLPPEQRVVKVYKHAVVGPRDRDDNYNYNTVDIQMYAWAESKHHRNAPIMRLAKRIATDCKLNRIRNQERGEVDGSRECDYTTCRYSCVGSEVDRYEQSVPVQDNDDTNYFLYYSNELSQRIIARLRELYTTSTSLSFDAILAANPETGAKYVLRTLSELVSAQEPFTTGFGKIAYLKEDNNTYFLQFEIDTTEPALSAYSEMLSVSNPTTLASFLAPIQNREVLASIAALEQHNADEQLNPLVIAASEEVKARLVERALIAIARTPTQEYILELLRNRWYHFENDQFSVPPQPMTIFLHDIGVQVESSGKYNSTTKSAKNANRIRILKDTDTAWRYVNAVEAQPYYDMIRLRDEEVRRDRFQDEPVIGEIPTVDGIFRLVMRDDNPGDRRKRSRGRMCHNFDKKALITILSSLGIAAPERAKANITREQMVRKLTNSYKRESFELLTTEEIRFRYEWIDVTLERMCGIIQKHLDERGLVTYT